MFYRKNLFLLCVAFSLNVNAGQTAFPNVQWTRALSVASSFGPSCISPLSQGTGFVIAGTTGDMNEKIFLLVTDQDGNETMKTLYSTFPEFQRIGAHYVHSVIQLADGGFALAGSRNVCMGASQENAWVIRTTAGGAVVWTKIFGTVNGGDDNTCSAECIRQTAEGAFMVSGRKAGNSWLCCCNGNGDDGWANTYDGTNAASFSFYPDGSIIAAGISFPIPLKSTFIQKISADGFLSWTRVSSINADSPDADRFPSLVQSSDNQTVTTACTAPSTGNCCIESFDSNADLLWKKCVCFCGTGYHSVKSLSSYGKNGCLIFGDMAPDRYTAPQGIWLVCMNAVGTEVWEWTTSEIQIARAAAPANGRSVVVLGERYSLSSGDLVLMKIAEQPRVVVPDATTLQKNGAPLSHAFADGRSSTVRLIDLRGRSSGSPQSYGAGTRPTVAAGMYVDITGVSKPFFPGNNSR
jgi:hypothetical protein